jgi:hypothetical protein
VGSGWRVHAAKHNIFEGKLAFVCDFRPRLPYNSNESNRRHDPKHRDDGIGLTSSAVSQGNT